MTDEITTPAAEPPKRRWSRRLIAYITVAVLVVAGGVTAAVVAVQRAEAAETDRLCTEALEAGAAQAAASAEQLAKADEALVAVEDTALPDTDGWKSNPYAERPGAEAVQDNPETDEDETAPARPSGAEHIKAVQDARGALAEIQIPETCDTREEAAEITSLADDTAAAVTDLETAVTALTEDFATFQEEEKTRIAAELEAKRKAEEEAARKAAEEAARKAAEEEAARRAAEEAARQQQYSGGGSSGGGWTGGGSNSGGGGYTAPAPAPAPAPQPPAGGGGGSVGGSPGSGNAPCRTSNGEGGTMPCG